MKAIVLSFDKQAGFAELTYKKYIALWEDCPFEFMIPVNNRDKYASFEYFENCKNVTLVDSKSDIRSTMQSLLEYINDEEWVYWCIDDRFPTEIKNLNLLKTLRDEIGQGKLDQYNGIKLFRWREEISEEFTTIADQKFYLQEPKSLFGFWLHSFVKAKVLRQIFLSKELPDIYKISDITTCFHPKNKIEVFEKTLIPEDDILLMGEPCIEGEITVNGYRELQKNGCPVPPYKITGQVKEFLHKDIGAYKKVSVHNSIESINKKRTYTHIVNPVGVPEDSDFYKVQQITFDAMKRARKESSDVDVEFMTAQYKEDYCVIPDYFKKTPDLEVSVLDVKTFSKNRKLPFIADILERAYKYSAADYIIFTNVDIIPSPEFYSEIDKMVAEGNNAFTVNRRTVELNPNDVDDLEKVFDEDGKKHPGHDCFIFPRRWIEEFNLGRVVVGVPWLGFSILANMACIGKGINVFQELKLTRHLGDDMQWMSPENLEYRDFNSYETLVLLADLQKRFGAFSPGGYLAQHVSLAIHQVKSAGTIVNYLSKRHEQIICSDRQMIFSISSGRAGSEYLKTVLGSAANVKAFHEPEPSMSGSALRSVMISPLDSSYSDRIVKAETLKEELSHYSPQTIYAETNHMFIKTFYDVILNEFSGIKISVIILRRSLEKVLRSFVKMGYFTDRNNAWPLWMHQVPNVNSILKPLKSFRDMDQYERSIAYLIDIEMRAQKFIEDFSSQCNIVEVDLEKIQTMDEVQQLFDSLDIHATPLTNDVIGAVVNDRLNRKKEISIDTDLDYCKERIVSFVNTHREAGIEIPHLPQFE